MRHGIIFHIVFIFLISPISAHGQIRKKVLQEVEIRDTVLMNAFQEMFDTAYPNGVWDLLPKPGVETLPLPFSLTISKSSLQDRYLVELCHETLTFEDLRFYFEYKGGTILVSRNVPMELFRATGRTKFYTYVLPMYFTGKNTWWYHKCYYWPYQGFDMIVNRSYIR